MMTTVFAVLLLLVSIVAYALLTAQDGGDDE
jgi:hypothetical protein